VNAVDQRRSLIMARVMCCFAVGLYTLSFFLPAFAIVIDENAGVSPGYAAFIVSMGSLFNPLLGGRLVLPWLANPMFAVAIYRFVRGRFKAAALLGICCRASG